MKRIPDEIVWLVMGVLFLSMSILLIAGGIYGLHRWITLPFEEKWIDSNIIGIVGALGAMTLGGSWVFSFSRHLYRKREVLKIPEKIPREEFDENSMRFVLTDLPLNRLRLEVLRNMSDEIFPGWRVYPMGEKDAGKRFNAVTREFKDASFPLGTEDPDPFMPLPMIDKLILHHHTRKLFQDGMIIGWRKTIWNEILFLGPQYLVAFPSGFIIATHKDGLQAVKSP